MAFRLYTKLPFDLQLEILRKLDLPDLVSFSFVCKETKDLVKALNLEIRRFVWSFRSENEYSIDLTIRSDTFLELSIFSALRYFLGYGDVDIASVKLNKVSRKVYLPDDRWFWFMVCDEKRHKLEVIDEFSTYLIDLFRIKKFCFKCYSGNVEEFSMFVSKYTRTFRTVDLSEDWNSPIFSVNQLTFMLKEFSFHTLFLNRVEFSDGDQYDGPLNINTLWADNMDWLTMNAILGMSCREVSSHARSSFSLSNCRALITAWMEGNCLKNLESFQVDNEELKDGRSHVKLFEDILDGIESFPYDKNNRPSHWKSTFTTEDEDVTNGRDVRRVDGTWATISLSSGFQFLVWKPKMSEEIDSDEDY